jgi:hypothetical protein
MRTLLQAGCLVLLVVAGNAPGAAAAQSVMHKPRIPVEALPGTRHTGWASSNWSGYALSGSGYTSIAGSWTVQAVTEGKGATYSSQWIGIDGFSNNSLIQTGTESDFVNGAAHYDAWWEILPAAETVITTVEVRPGDQMTASVTKGNSSMWTISIKDTTNGQSFSTTKNYTGPAMSAEWIEEAPTVGGHVATLANYALATFDPGSINVNGKPGLTASESGVMIQHNRQVSTPSTPDRDADGFNTQYSSTPPAPPSS